jgi:hypothetical protein
VSGSLQFEVAPDDSEFAGVSIALGELMAALQFLDPQHRRLLEQVWQAERDEAAATQPALARIFDALQALVLQFRLAGGEVDG